MRNYYYGLLVLILALLAGCAAPPARSSAAAEHAAIEVAVRDSLRSSSLADFQVRVEAIVGDYARVAVIPAGRGAAEPALGFVCREGAGWRMIGGLGSGFTPEYYIHHGIPPSLQK